MKKCTKCGVEKMAEEFSKMAAAKDGMQSNCKACNKVSSAEYRDANSEAIAARDAEYCQTPAGKETQRKANATRRAKSPEKAAARTAVSNAIAAGRLVRQPCLVCGETERVEAHHDSYHENRRLDVRWLCRPHHLEHHALMKKVMSLLAPYPAGLL